MIRLLGRQTSGNVQKVIFLLEEIQKPYTREDYGRQFNNTTTPEYKAASRHLRHQRGSLFTYFSKFRCASDMSG